MNRPADVLDAGAARDALVAAVPELAPEGPLVLERAWPGRRWALVATYREPRPFSPSRRWTFVVPSEDDLPRSIRRSLQRGRAVALGSHGVIAFPFPHDPGLASLGEMLNGGRAQARLADILGVGRIAECDVTAVSYKPMRRLVVRYRTTNGNAETSEWVAKALRPGDDVRCAATHLAWQRGRIRCGPDTALAIEVPHARVEAWSTVVWSRARGVHARELLSDSVHVTTVAERIGVALAELQRIRLPWSPLHTSGSELDVVERWSDAIPRFRPDVAHEIGEAVRATRRAVVPNEPDRFVPCHRDFHDGQVLVEGNRVTVLDLDTACRADPELDVANFLAHLTFETARSSGRCAEPARASFLDAYRRARVRHDPKRLAFYEACALTRVACVHALRGCDAAVVKELAEAACAVVAAIDRRIVDAS